jgi:hypothetical protein
LIKARRINKIPHSRGSRGKWGRKRQGESRKRQGEGRKKAGRRQKKGKKKNKKAEKKDRRAGGEGDSGQGIIPALLVGEPSLMPLVGEPPTAVIHFPQKGKWTDYY